jgi:hypothetical protein
VKVFLIRSSSSSYGYDFIVEEFITDEYDGGRVEDC